MISLSQYTNTCAQSYTITNINSIYIVDYQIAEYCEGVHNESFHHFNQHFLSNNGHKIID